MSTFSERIQASADDGTKTVGSGYYTYTGNSLAVGYDVNYYIPAIRFSGVTIPAGSTINSAYLTFTQAYGYYTPSGVPLKIYGIDEDDTATMSSDPTGRTKTTNNLDFDLPSGNISDGTTLKTGDIKAIVQEIVDRAGWNTGQAMGFFLIDDGVPSGYGYSQSLYAYNGSTTKCALLEIDYTAPPANSASLSASASVSLSPSSSYSPSSSVSLSPSITPSSSVSPSIGAAFFGLKIAKPGINVLMAREPHELIFDSDFGTLKYFTKQTINITVKSNSTDLEIRGSASYAHNLGYFPFVEVYMKDPLGTYAYCPCLLTGASTFSKGGYTIDENNINFWVDNSGYPSFNGNQTYTFIFFIFKNNLNL